MHAQKENSCFPIGNHAIMHQGTRAGQRSDGLIPISGALYIAQPKTTLPVETVVSTLHFVHFEYLQADRRDQFMLCSGKIISFLYCILYYFVSGCTFRTVPITLTCIDWTSGNLSRLPLPLPGPWALFLTCTLLKSQFSVQVQGSLHFRNDERLDIRIGLPDFFDRLSFMMGYFFDL